MANRERNHEVDLITEEQKFMIQSLFDYLEDDSTIYSAWESNFIKDMVGKLERPGYKLSDAQHDVLVRIWEKD